MFIKDYEGEASGSFLQIYRHIDMFDLAEVIEGAYNGLTCHFEVNVVNEELCKGVRGLFACVRWLLLCDFIIRLFYSNDCL